LIEQVQPPIGWIIGSDERPVYLFCRTEKEAAHTVENIKRYVKAGLHTNVRAFPVFVSALSDDAKDKQIAALEALVNEANAKLVWYLEQDQDLRDRALKDAEHLLRPYLTTGAVFGFTPDHRWNANGTPFAVIDAVQAIFMRAEAAEAELARLKASK
jgi:hypothetical protein